MRECFSTMKQVYEVASGQTLNNQKTCIFFNSNTKRDVINQIMHMSKAKIRGDS